MDNKKIFKKKNVSKKHILIVDDEEKIIDSFKKFFIKEGYHVTSAGSGKEALEILKKEKFDLVILDVLMPEMTGVELAKKIRENSSTAKLKIIFLTVVEQAGKEVLETMQLIKPKKWLRKPVDINTLRSAVSDALQKP